MKEVNLTKAAEYYEKADELGSIDATYNLGHLYHKGEYPNKEGKDMVILLDPLTFIESYLAPLIDDLHRRKSLGTPLELYSVLNVLSS